MILIIESKCNHCNTFKIKSQRITHNYTTYCGCMHLVPATFIPAHLFKLSNLKRTQKKHNARPNIIIQRITATSADIASHPRLNLWSLVPLQRIMDHCLCFSCRFQTFLSKLSVNRPLHQGTVGTFLCRNRLFVAVVVVFCFVLTETLRSRVMPHNRGRIGNGPWNVLRKNITDRMAAPWTYRIVNHWIVSHCRWRVAWFILWLLYFF